MRINSISNYNSPSFKRIVSKGFLISMQKEVDNYAKKGDNESIEELSKLYDEAEEKTKDFDIEVLPPPKIESRDGEKKIIRNKTVVWLNSIDAPIIYRAGKKSNKNLAGKIIYKTDASLPYKQILSADGWATGVGYLTENMKYPHAKDVLERIIFWAEYAQHYLKRGITIEEEQTRKETRLRNKLAKAIKKL